MTKNYVDDAGKVVAHFEGGRSFRADRSLVGVLQIDGDIIDEAGETVMVVFHEGLYLGPLQDPIARLHPSEFDK